MYHMTYMMKVQCFDFAPCLSNIFLINIVLIYFIHIEL
jgi:hypothetical protein